MKKGRQLNSIEKSKKPSAISLTGRFDIQILRSAIDPSSSPTHFNTYEQNLKKNCFVRYTARMHRRRLLLFLASFKMGLHFFCLNILPYLKNTKRNCGNFQRREIVADNCLAQPYTVKTTCFVAVVVLTSAIREGRYNAMNRGMTVEDFATLYLPADCGPRKDP